MHLLRTAVGVHLGMLPPTDLRAAAAVAIDWNVVERVAWEHRIVTQVFAALRSAGITVIPDTLLSGLRRASLDNAQSALRQCAEIKRLLAATDAAGVRVLVFKGVVLAMQLFGAVDQRGARDIDLLVAPEDQKRTDAILQAMGYRPTSNARYAKEVEYVHHSHGTCIELHNRLTDNCALLDWDFESLWNERQTVTIGDMVVPVMSRSRLPIYLCVHGASHGWLRLRWLADLAAVLPDDQSDLSRLVALAKAHGIGDIMLQAISLIRMSFAPADAGNPLRDGVAPDVSRLDYCLSRFLANNSVAGEPRPKSWLLRQKQLIWFRLYRFGAKASWRYRGNEIVFALLHPVHRAAGAWIFCRRQQSASGIRKA
jgi:hypothetical protein